MTTPGSGIPLDIRERIVAAAVEIYEKSNKEKKPTVAEVRRLARSDMNSTSEVMKQWWREQTVQAAPVAIAVPDVVAQAHNTAVATTWLEAQKAANESLSLARAAWDVERLEFEEMRKELSISYDNQASEIEDLILQTEAETQAHLKIYHKLEEDFAAMSKDYARETVRADRAEALQADAEKKVIELRIELESSGKEREQLRIDLDRACYAAEHLKTELSDSKSAFNLISEELNKVRSELAKAEANTDRLTQQIGHDHQSHVSQYDRSVEQFNEAREELHKALQDASNARELAAELRGQLNAHKEQIIELLSRLAPTQNKEGVTN